MISSAYFGERRRRREIRNWSMSNEYINSNVKYKSTFFFLTKRSCHSHCFRSASSSDASICQARASAKHVRLATSTKREGPWERERERMAKRRLSPFSLPFVLCARSCPSKKRETSGNRRWATNGEVWFWLLCRLKDEKGATGTGMPQSTEPLLRPMLLN